MKRDTLNRNAARAPNPTHSFYPQQLPQQLTQLVTVANDTESAAAEALKDLKIGRFPSLRAAARSYGLSESRLRRRSEGTLPKRLAHKRYRASYYVFSLKRYRVSNRNYLGVI
jgi:hypothetical protein